MIIIIIFLLKIQGVLKVQQNGGHVERLYIEGETAAHEGDKMVAIFREKDLN